MTNYPAVLVLNASYEALDLVPWQSAIVLVLQDKATVHQNDPSGAVIHSQRLQMPLPSVIVLNRYVLVPHRELDEHSTASVAAVLQRDKNRCAYCGGWAATVDHVLPRSRGGPNTWANLVAACIVCNQLKADLTPEEAGMPLLWQPRVPDRSPVPQRRIWRELAAV